MNRLFSTIVALAAAGCAGVPAPLADRAGSPASASAPESPRSAFTAPELTPATAGKARSTTSPLHDRGAGSEHGAKAGYTCSMHPEVHSDAPGQCTLCGMNLVPESEPRKP